MEDVTETAKKVRDSAGQVARAGAAETAKLAKRVYGTEAFKNVAAWAGVGAVVAVPVPFVGPIAGAIVGGAVGLMFGDRLRTKVFGPRIPPSDIHAELLKFEALRDKGVISEEEFGSCKQKLLDKL